MNDLLKPKKAAEILDVSVKTLYEWAKLEKISSVKLFNEIRFRKNEIEDICKNGLHQPETMSNIVRPKTKKLKQAQELAPWEKLRAKSAG